MILERGQKQHVRRVKQHPWVCRQCIVVSPCASHRTQNLLFLTSVAHTNSRSAKTNHYNIIIKTHNASLSVPPTQKFMFSQLHTYISAFLQSYLLQSTHLYSFLISSPQSIPRAKTQIPNPPFLVIPRNSFPICSFVLLPRQRFCACFHLPLVLRIFPLLRKYYTFCPRTACRLLICHCFHYQL